MAKAVNYWMEEDHRRSFHQRKLACEAYEKRG